MRATKIYLGDAEDMFKDYLNDSYEPYKIGYGTFYPSDILQECDPVAFRIGLGEFMDNLVESADIYVEGYNDNEMPTDDDEDDDAE